MDAQARKQSQEAFMANAGAVVVATADEPPLVRVRAAVAATAVAEYFRVRGKKVLLLIDSLSRVGMAQREIGLAAGEPIYGLFA